MPKFLSLDKLDHYLAADLTGNPIPLTRRTVGKRSVYSAVGEIDEMGSGRSSLSDSVASHQSMLNRRCSYIDALVGRISAQNVALLQSIFLMDRPMSLHEIAVREGKTPQAISQRLRVLRRKFPEIDSWWLTDHENWKRIRAAEQRDKNDVAA